MRRFVICLILFIAVTFAAQNVTAAERHCNDEAIVVFGGNGEDSGNWYWCSVSKQIERLETNIAGISPNGEWIARYDYTDTPFVIQIIPFGETEPALVIQSEGDWLASGLQWVGDQTITFNVLDETGEYTGKKLLINPWTGETERLKFDLPYQSDELDQRFKFSPDFNYVVYSANDARLQPSHQLILYDVRDAKVLWQTPIETLTPPFSYDPVWALDSSTFVYTGLPENASTFAFEMFSVSTQGIQKQITNLGQDGSVPSLIFAPHLSPDERFVAFWKASPQEYMTVENGFRFALIDIEIGQLREFDLIHANSGNFDMAWSPDSDAIAVISTAESNQQNLSVLNVKSGEVEPIANRVAEINVWCICKITHG